MEFDSTPERKSQFIEDERLYESTAENVEGYFVISTTKFILMSLCTFGFYEVYWMYKNWKYIKIREQSDIMPFWRAFFSGIWTFSLGRKIKDHSAKVSAEIDLHPDSIGVLYLLTGALWRLPDPFGLLSCLSFIPLLSLQAGASKVNQVLEIRTNKYYNFSTTNYLILAFGTLLWLLIVVGAFIPAEL
ncbi:MAG: hypothetical protein AAGD25_24950 [Cyanobacteria bacterium P01_F01_bin.150]